MHTLKCGESPNTNATNAGLECTPCELTKFNYTQSNRAYEINLYVTEIYNYYF